MCRRTCIPRFPASTTRPSRETGCKSFRGAQTIVRKDWSIECFTPHPTMKNRRKLSSPLVRPRSKKCSTAALCIKMQVKLMANRLRILRLRRTFISAGYTGRLANNRALTDVYIHASLAIHYNSFPYCLKYLLALNLRLIKNQ